MRMFLLPAVVTVVLSTACAQQAPHHGMGPGATMGSGRGPMTGSEYTSGWSMMSPQERDEHHRRMMSARTSEECRRMRDEHAQRMDERARAQGAAGAPVPMHDACAGMQP